MKITSHGRRKSVLGIICVVGLLSVYASTSVALTNLSISQVPLTEVIPTQPQVLVVITNSQSMDGTTNGDMMVGSGTADSSLFGSSSPVNYTVPSGFTPPLQAANVAGQAPYTVLQLENFVDNGPSRLNMAKQALSAILANYMQNTQFGLMTYNVSNPQVYTTWAYYTSVMDGDFVFTSTPQTGKRYVANPCMAYNENGNGGGNSTCNNMANIYGANNLKYSTLVQILNSSDDNNINDVLHYLEWPPVSVTYNGPTPATPYPPNFSLSNYNAGNVSLTYQQSQPTKGGLIAVPTNAGYIPYSPHVLYAQRGFGYAGNASSTTGKLVVAMTSAGLPPTTASVTTAINKFVSFLLPETNNLSTTEIKASASQSPIAGVLTQAKTYLTSLSTAGTCPTKQYVLLITDGLPTQDLSGKYWPPLDSAAAQGYGVTATFNTDGSLNTTNNQALLDTINTITSLKNAGIKTYVIGLGAGIDPTVNPMAAKSLTAMAVAGGTIDYYPDTSPQALVQDLNNIMISVQNGDFTTTASAVSSTHLQSGTKIYQASFSTSDTPYQDWTGNITEKELDANTGFPVGPVLWDARSLLDTAAAGNGWNTNRIIATWNPTLYPSSGGGVPFRWANLNAAEQTLLQPIDTLGTNRVDYIRGNSALEQRNGGTFRNRSHILGDIVYSQPLYVGAPDSPYFSTSYMQYMQDKANRQPMLYVGANDGMLHAFNATTGAEVFAYVPYGVFDNLFNLSSPLYNQSHLFFVNGSPQSGDVIFTDGNWHTVLVGGQAAGGNSIYAIDVTDPTSINTEAKLAQKVLWDFVDTDLGLTYSEPVIAPINSASGTPKFAVFFGNGYNNPNNTSILYALDPQTGQVLQKMNLCLAVPTACNALQPQGLSSVAVGNSDGLQGQPITTVYAGDLQGNMWAINVTNTNPATWTAKVLFKARDSLGVSQPITVPPAITLQPSYPRLQGLFVLFGTGQLLTQADLSSLQTQSVYGVWDKPLPVMTYTRANLQAQTLSFVTAATSGLAQDIILSTNNTVNWGTNVGWYNDLLFPGQMVVTTPQLLNGAFVVTLNTPPSLLTCNAPFTSMLLEINYSTGGSFQYPQLDITADAIINLNDVYQGKYATGVGLAAGYASTPTIVGTTASNYFVKIITQSGGQQSKVLNPNNTTRRTGWWQIQ